MEEIMRIWIPEMIYRFVPITAITIGIAGCFAVPTGSCLILGLALVGYGLFIFVCRLRYS